MTMVQSRALGKSAFMILCWAVFIVGSVMGLRHNSFVQDADGLISPRTAERMGLLSDREAPFSNGLAFKDDAHAGFAYRETGVAGVMAPTMHTRLDLRAECRRLAGCQVVR